MIVFIFFQGKQFNQKMLGVRRRESERKKNETGVGDRKGRWQVGREEEKESETDRGGGTYSFDNKPKIVEFVFSSFMLKKHYNNANKTNTITHLTIHCSIKAKKLQIIAVAYSQIGRYSNYSPKGR